MERIAKLRPTAERGTKTGALSGGEPGAACASPDEAGAEGSIPAGDVGQGTLWLVTSCEPNGGGTYDKPSQRRAQRL